MLLSEKSNDPKIERIAHLVDTTTTLQETVNEKTKTIQLLEEEYQKLERDLSNYKNERKIG